jgi:GT2 family glycosyltransferase
VTAVLLLRHPGPWLIEALDSLAGQTRAPERLLVVETGADGEAVDAVRGHAALGEAVGEIRFVTVPAGLSRGQALRRALAELGDSSGAREGSGAAAGPDATSGDAATSGDRSNRNGAADGDESFAAGGDEGTPAAGRPVEHLWLLTDDSAPDPTALARLVDAVRRSPSVGAAGPKLLRWDQPGALDSVGLQLTRAGRVIPSPVPGEPDQGQYDRRTDVLAVPFTGLLIERTLYDELGGHDPAFGDFGGDIDLSWRAHQAARRVVVVPRATLRVGASGPPEGTGSRRRGARRVALTRCSPLVAPFLALWIALSSLVAGVVLLAAKQPRSAWAELSDIGAVVDPWRVLAARWRGRGSRVLRRRDISGLFVRPAAALRHTSDLVHDQVFLHTDPADRPHAPVEALESGPVSDDAMDLQVLSASWVSRAARNPGVLAVAVATVVTLFAGRSLPGGLAARFQTGLAGGELIGVRATSSTLWHAWLDGWHGAGLGHSGEQSPHLAAIASLAWVAEHLPGAEPSGTTVGAAVATLLGLTLPLATAAAYLGARVVTHSGWPRALAALAWSSTAVVGTALGGGRLGGAVAAILLPLVAAGFALAARRHSGITATAATVFAAALVGAFVPALLVVAAACALLLVVLGPGHGPRLRGLAFLVLPPALMGPWLVELVESPYRLLAGPGLTLWGAPSAAPWEIALAHPGGPGSHPVLFTAPLVAAGLAGLLRGGRRSAGATVLALLALLGLALALAAPRMVLGTVPEGLPEAGEPITAWPGTGLLLYTLALIAAALLGADQLPVRRAEGGWLAVSRWPVAVAVVVAVLASAGWTAWKAIGAELSTWTDPRPAVAIDQAETGLSNRMLLLEAQGRQVAYQLLGREVSDVARDLPVPIGRRPAESGLASAVGLVFEQGGSPEAPPVVDALAAQGIGFVGLRAEESDPALRTLDATAGLSRLGEHEGVIFWRVMPSAEPADDTIAPSRARVVTPDGEQPVGVTGSHGRTSVPLPAAKDASLVVAEPAEWARHARVSVNGQVLRAQPGSSQPTYALPPAGGHLVIEVLPTHQNWRWAQLALLAAVAVLALPLGGRTRRSRS